VGVLGVALVALAAGCSESPPVANGEDNATPSSNPYLTELSLAKLPAQLNQFYGTNFQDLAALQKEYWAKPHSMKNVGNEIPSVGDDSLPRERPLQYSIEGEFFTKDLNAAREQLITPPSCETSGENIAANFYRLFRPSNLDDPTWKSMPPQERARWHKENETGYPWHRFIARQKDSVDATEDTEQLASNDNKSSGGIVEIKTTGSFDTMQNLARQHSYWRKRFGNEIRLHYHLTFDASTRANEPAFANKIASYFSASNLFFFLLLCTSDYYVRYIVNNSFLMYPNNETLQFIENDLQRSAKVIVAQNEFKYFLVGLRGPATYDLRRPKPENTTRLGFELRAANYRDFDDVAFGWLTRTSLFLESAFSENAVFKLGSRGTPSRGGNFQIATNTISNSLRLPCHNVAISKLNFDPNFIRPPGKEIRGANEAQGRSFW